MIEKALIQLVVEVMSRMAGGDPPIKIYHTRLITKSILDMDPEWTETFGSREQLQAYLLGLKSALIANHWNAYLLDWDMPEGWTEPAGCRWTISRLGDEDNWPLCEYINSNGEVIEI